MPLTFTFSRFFQPAAATCSAARPAASGWLCAAILAFSATCVSADQAPQSAEPPVGSAAAKTAARLDALLPAEVLLVGEQHDAKEHQQLEQQIIAVLAKRDHATGEPCAFLDLAPVAARLDLEARFPTVLAACRVLVALSAQSIAAVEDVADVAQVQLADPVRLPAIREMYPEAPAPWVIEFNRYDAAVKALAKERQQLSLEVRGTLAAFTTVEKLAQEWPEGYAHFPHESLVAGGPVPALRIEDLNARLAAAREAA